MSRIYILGQADGAQYTVVALCKYRYEPVVNRMCRLMVGMVAREMRERRMIDVHTRVWMHVIFNDCKIAYCEQGDVPQEITPEIEEASFVEMRQQYMRFHYETFDAKTRKRIWVARPRRATLKAELVNEDAHDALRTLVSDIRAGQAAAPVPWAR